MTAHPAGSAGPAGLSGRSAVVTSGRNGIGVAIAHRQSGAGARERRKALTEVLSKSVDWPDVYAAHPACARAPSGRPTAWVSSTPPSGVTRNRFSLRTPNWPGR
jgi:hypothetical protein